MKVLIVNVGELRRFLKPFTDECKITFFDYNPITEACPYIEYKINEEGEGYLTITTSLE